MQEFPIKEEKHLPLPIIPEELPNKSKKVFVVIGVIIVIIIIIGIFILLLPKGQKSSQSKSRPKVTPTITVSPTLAPNSPEKITLDIKVVENGDQNWILLY